MFLICPELWEIRSGHSLMTLRESFFVKEFVLIVESSLELDIKVSCWM